jgi:hypothetical protein
MLQAAVAAALLGTLPRAGRGAEPEGTLLVLAATLAPSDGWRDAALAGSLRARCGDEHRAALALLDKAAGGSFAALPQDRRNAVLAELIEKDEKFAEAFGPLRSVILDVFFTSGAGMALTGFRDCTQFAGYPEYVSLSVEWE